jgi:hypothetical protein
MFNFLLVVGLVVVAGLVWWLFVDWAWLKGDPATSNNELGRNPAARRPDTTPRIHRAVLFDTLAIVGLVLVLAGMRGSFELLFLGAILGLFALPGAVLSGVLLVRYARSRGVATPWVAFGCVVLCLLSVAVGPVIVSACGPDCAPWSGSNAEAIDEGVDRMNFAEVGDVVCDYRRPTYIGGNTAYRFIGIEDARNVDAVLDMLRDAGFRYDGEPSKYSYYLAGDGLAVTVSPISVERSSYAFSHCATPPDGVVEVSVNVR